MLTLFRQDDLDLYAVGHLLLILTFRRKRCIREGFSADLTRHRLSRVLGLMMDDRHAKLQLVLK